MSNKLEEYEYELKERPRDYFGEIDTWMDDGFSNSMFAVHRDSDILEQSNWIQINQALEAYIESDDVRIASSSHWAVGWCDTLHVRMRDDDGEFTEAFKAACELKERLDNYPVLDEEHYSLMEHDDFMEYLEQEVGSEYAEALARYLFDKYSVCSSEEVRWKWIEEWKEAYLVRED